MSNNAIGMIKIDQVSCEILLLEFGVFNSPMSKEQLTFVLPKVFTNVPWTWGS